MNNDPFDQKPFLLDLAQNVGRMLGEDLRRAGNGLLRLCGAEEPQTEAVDELPDNPTEDAVRRWNVQHGFPENYR